MGCLLILVLSAFLGLVISVIFFFGTDYLKETWIFWTINVFLLLSLFVIKFGMMSWEQFFYGVNWLTNPNLWKWAITPIN